MSECGDGVCITCSDTAVEVTVLRLLADELAVVDTGAGVTLLRGASSLNVGGSYR